MVMKCYVMCYLERGYFCDFYLKSLRMWMLCEWILWWKIVVGNDLYVEMCLVYIFREVIVDIVKFVFK